MRLIFSRDRPAQLDLLLRSLQRYSWHESTRILHYASTRAFAAGYELLPVDRTMTNLFDLELRRALLECPDETVTFFCDDDVMFNHAPRYDLTEHDNVLTYSLRLGRQNKSRPWPGEVWDWTDFPRSDFGFPGSIDGHTFRTQDVWWMIGDTVIADPTALETVLAQRCELYRDVRPWMACPHDQAVVGVPVNRVSERSRVPFGLKHPQTPERLNKRFLGGSRICMDALDFSGVEGCHHELQFEWEGR